MPRRLRLGLWAAALALLLVYIARHITFVTDITNFLPDGSDSELVSNLGRQGFQDIKFKTGIARGRDGQPLASLELVTVINLESVDAPQGMNINVRGLLPVGIELRPRLKVESGRWFQTGRREVVVGRSIAERFPDARLGKRLTFGGGDWEVVGVMNAGRAAQDSEIFADLNQLSADLHRPDGVREWLAEALVALERRAGARGLDRLLAVNPRRILAGEELA